MAKERVVFPDGIRVYNFTVDGNHNYFVLAKDDEFGQTCILVHNAEYDIPKAGIRLFIERLPQHNTAEISISRMVGNKTVELARLKYVIDPKTGIGTLHGVLSHGGKALDGVPSKVMDKITKTLGKKLDSLFKIGGSLTGQAATEMAEKAARASAKKAALNAITKIAVFWLAVGTEIFSANKAADAAEIPRPIRYSLSLEDLDFSKEEIQELESLFILMESFDVPPPSLIKAAGLA